MEEVFKVDSFENENGLQDPVSAVDPLRDENSTQQDPVIIDPFQDEYSQGATQPDRSDDTSDLSTNENVSGTESSEYSSGVSDDRSGTGY